MLILEKSAFFRQANKKGSKNKVHSIGEIKEKRLYSVLFFLEGTAEFRLVLLTFLLVGSFFICKNKRNLLLSRVSEAV